MSGVDIVRRDEDLRGSGRFRLLNDGSGDAGDGRGGHSFQVRGAHVIRSGGLNGASGGASGGAGRSCQRRDSGMRAAAATRFVPFAVPVHVHVCV